MNHSYAKSAETDFPARLYRAGCRLKGSMEPNQEVEPQRDSVEVLRIRNLHIAINSQKERGRKYALAIITASDQGDFVL